MPSRTTFTSTQSFGGNVLTNGSFGGFTDPSGTERPYDYSTTDLLRCFQTNVFAPFYLVRAAVPLMPRGGCVLVTASGVVTDPIPFGVDYGASKGAATYMVRGMSQQLVPQGIRVNGVAPGMTYTPFLASFGATEEFMESFMSQYPYRRPAQPAELAPLYVALVDPVQTYTSGEIFSGTGAVLGT